MCGFFAIGRPGYWNSSRKPREVPITFRERVRGKSKMSFAVVLRFFFAGCAPCLSISSAAFRGLTETQT